jgi:hypothetical protein
MKIVEEMGSISGMLTWTVSGLGYEEENNFNNNQNSMLRTVATAGESTDTKLYLRVEVFPTAFPFLTAQFVTIYVNGVNVMDYCAPGIECGSDYYLCLADYDVSNHVLSTGGGSLQVTVTATGLSPSICDKNGYSLFMRFTLHDTATPQTQAPSIHIEEVSSTTPLSNIQLNYQVKPGFMLSLAVWVALGALVGLGVSRFRAESINHDRLVIFSW